MLVHMRFIGQTGCLESDAGFFGGVPPYVVDSAGNGPVAMKQILDSGGNSECSLVVQAQQSYSFFALHVRFKEHAEGRRRD